MERQKTAWFILDEIAVKHSATHVHSTHWGEAPPQKGCPEPWPCPICDRAEEAMRLLNKPTAGECRELYETRRTKLCLN